MSVISITPWTVLSGDCRETLAGLPAESVDAVVTDTPYGLSTILDPPNLDRETLWQKLTSGAKESPIKTLMRSWLDTGENPQVKGRGFMGKEWDALVPPPNTWREVWRVLKPGAYCLAFGGTRTYALIEMSLRFADFEVEDTVSWLYGQGFPKRVRVDLKIDQNFGKAGERPVLLDRGEGRKSYDGLGERRGAFQEAEGARRFVHGPATPDAARFVGWDRALRPGWEPIIVAVKPLRGTVAETALSYGTGGLHVDACRIARGDAGEVRSARNVAGVGKDLFRHGDKPAGHVEMIDPRGGYPANVAMDEEVAERLDRGGMPSRFFYTAKASSSERDAGLEDLPPLTAGERSDREDDTAGINGYAGTRGEGGRNPHPTVKPIALMRWLIRLVSPPGANDPDPDKRPVILDPFAGSGSTGVACMREGVRFIGCELEDGSVEVMRRRLQHAYAMPPDDPEAPRRHEGAPGQRVLF